MMQDEKGRTAGNSVPMIYKALAGVIADVGTVAKDKVNKQQGFKFRSIDDVYNALHPALAKNKVVIIPRVLERKCEVVGKTQKGTDMIKVICKVKFGFYAEDGSNEEAIIYGEGIDTGDKATNKAMAIAYKYACLQMGYELRSRSSRQTSVAQFPLVGLGKKLLLRHIQAMAIRQRLYNGLKLSLIR